MQTSNPRPTLNHCERAELACAYALQVLPASELPAIQTHIASCIGSSPGPPACSYASRLTPRKTLELTRVQPLVRGTDILFRRNRRRQCSPSSRFGMLILPHARPGGTRAHPRLRERRPSRMVATAAEGGLNQHRGFRNVFVNEGTGRPRQARPPRLRAQLGVRAGRPSALGESPTCSSRGTDHVRR
jgi:hypothetical protein